LTDTLSASSLFRTTDEAQPVGDPYRAVWWLSWLLLATFLAALVGLVVYGDSLRERLEMAGVPAGAELLFLAVGLDHLNASARAISEKHVRAVLKDGVQGSST
jgi:hypothetical protein